MRGHQAGEESVYELRTGCVVYNQNDATDRLKFAVVIVSQTYRSRFARIAQEGSVHARRACRRRAWSFEVGWRSVSKP